MGQFLYAVSVDKPVDLDKIGLGKIIRRPAECRSVSKGPAATCAIFTAGDGKYCKYDPGDQIWIKSVVGDWWVGYWTGDKPTAADLARAGQLAGHAVKLADGGSWSIPIVRAVDGGCGLPAAIRIGKEGLASTKPLAEYSKLSATAGRLWEDMLISVGKIKGPKKTTEKERISLVIDAIGLNYHAGPDEINALEILTTQNLTAIMGAILDVPTLIEDVKKKQLQSGDSDLTDGAAD